MKTQQINDISDNIQFYDLDENPDPEIEGVLPAPTSVTTEGQTLQRVKVHELPTATYEPEFYNEKQDGIINNAMIQAIQAVPAVMNDTESEGLLVPQILVNAELEVTRDDTNTVHLQKKLVLYDAGEITQSMFGGEEQ